MIKQHVEQPEGSEPMGVCDCGFTADECGTNPCMRKKIHLAGLTPGSKWPNTGQPAPAAPSSASVAGDTRSADAPRKALDGAGWTSHLSPKCPHCLCTPLHCNCAVYSAYMPAPAQGTVNSRLAEFFKWAMREGPWEGSDLDGGGVQDKAEELGLIVKTKYDAKTHGPSNWMFEDGDDYYVFAPDLAVQPPAAPVETDRQKLLDVLPLQFEEGPDYCTVRDAKGKDFALTVQPDILKEMESALRVALVASMSAPQSSAETVQVKHDHRVYFACECCHEHAPENGVCCREDIAVMPDGTWLCDGCYSDCDKTAYGMVIRDIDDFEFPRFENLPRPAPYTTQPQQFADTSEAPVAWRYKDISDKEWLLTDTIPTAPWDLVQALYPAPSRASDATWRCFYCNEVFITKDSAKEHFRKYGDDPACLADRETEKCLIQKIVKAQAERDEARAEIERLYGCRWPDCHTRTQPQEAPEQAAKKPAIDPKQIKAIDDFLADGQEDKGYRAFAMMRHLWPKFRELALASSEAK